MAKWEFKITETDSLPSPSAEKRLTQLGQEGWEIVTAQFLHTPPSDRLTLWAVLKREVIAAVTFGSAFVTL